MATTLLVDISTITSLMASDRQGIIIQDQPVCSFVVCFHCCFHVVCLLFVFTCFVCCLFSLVLFVVCFHLFCLLFVFTCFVCCLFSLVLFVVCFCVMFHFHMFCF